MGKSIIQTDKACYLSGETYNLHKHHIFGAANRKFSEKYGLWIYLTPQLHNIGDNCVHKNRGLDLRLKQKGQAEFEKIHGHEKFMQVFGRNYLD